MIRILFGCDSGNVQQQVVVKMWIGLLAKILETRSSLRCGAWPQLMCCALVAVWIPEVRRGWVGALEQGSSLDDDQDSERRGGNKLEVKQPKTRQGCTRELKIEKVLTSD